MARSILSGFARRFKTNEQRAPPLAGKTVAALRAWLRDRQGQPSEPLFPSKPRASLSGDAVALLLAKHADVASRDCATLKNRVHVIAGVSPQWPLACSSPTAALGDC
jgi:hypothetical protein